MTEHDHVESGARIVRLLAIARGLEDEGQYNVARLFRATAWGEGVRATVDRPRLSTDLLDQMDAAITDLRDSGRADVAEAMTEALAAVRDGGIPTLETTPLTFTCRSCGEVILNEAPVVCPICRARRLTFEPTATVWYSAPMTPAEILGAMEANVEDIQAMTDGVRESRADEGAWPARAILEHLLGCERVLVGRALRMLEEDEPQFVPVDPNDIGVDEGDGAVIPVAALVEDLLQERLATVAQFAEIAPAEWLRAGTHPEFGRMTVTQQLAYLVRHEQWHLAELEARCREARQP